MPQNGISNLVALEGSVEGLKRALRSAERSLGELAASAKTAGEKDGRMWPSWWRGGFRGWRGWLRKRFEGFSNIQKIVIFGNAQGGKKTRRENRNF